MGRKRGHQTHSRSARQPSTPAVAAEEMPQARSWWKKALAILLPPGLLIATVPVLITQNVGGLSDTFQQLLGRDPLTVHAETTDDLRPGPFRVWALAGSLG